MSRSINGLYGRLRRWRRYSETVRELKRLSPRELADVGISPVEIDRIAREAARI